LIDRDLTLVLPFLRRRRSTVNAQSFIPGREATSLVACWKGAVLGGLHFEVINKQDQTGPASVMRLIDNAEMAGAAEKMARRLNLSGLHGFDFVLEAASGNAHLIEINPRATQVGHLALGPGRDLPAVLYGALSAKTVHQAPSITDKDTIALFPQEWTRDPASGFLRSAYHDVPWSEAELIRACVRRQRRWSALYAQQKWGQVFSASRLTRL
jgi:ATP-grasp domain